MNKISKYIGQKVNDMENDSHFIFNRPGSWPYVRIVVAAVIVWIIIIAILILFGWLPALISGLVVVALWPTIISATLEIFFNIIFTSLFH